MDALNYIQICKSIPLASVLFRILQISYLFGERKNAEKKIVCSCLSYEKADASLGKSILNKSVIRKKKKYALKFPENGFTLERLSFTSV